MADPRVRRDGPAEAVALRQGTAAPRPQGRPDRGARRQRQPRRSTDAW